MNTSRVRTARATSGTRLLTAVGAATALGMVLSACGGQVGDANDGRSAQGAGVGINATADEYLEALADMPETTLVLQSFTTSETGHGADIWLNFQESVQELSGGKITIDLVWSQAVATYPEVEDALVDGRLDIAYHLPHYEPAAYPVHSAYVTATSLAEASPRAEELVANAAITEIAWNTPSLIEEFEAKGLHPLILSNPGGTVFNMCNASGATEDWQGLQVRAPSAANQSEVEALGGTAVSLEHVETYEALQRNTIDCSIGAALTAVVGGIMEIAPHVQYTESASFARPPGTLMAGTAYGNLPLAGQQLIFDQMGNVFRDWRATELEGNVLAAEAVREFGGSYAKLDDELEQRLIEHSDGLLDDLVAEGLVDESIRSDLPAALEKWRSVVEEMNLGDEGGFEDMDEWHDVGEVDLGPFSDRVFEEAFAAHRPS